VQEIGNSNPGTVKFDTATPTRYTFQRNTPNSEYNLKLCNTNTRNFDEKGLGFKFASRSGN